MVVSYDADCLVFEVFAPSIPAALIAPAPAYAAPAPQAEADPVVCRCLQVRESAVIDAVQTAGCSSLCQIACSTGAGSGCTACHRKLRQYFAERRHAKLEQAAADCGS